MGPEAVKLMRAIKLRYPNVEAGAMVDPSSYFPDSLLETVLQKSQSCFHKPFLRHFSRPR